MKKFILLLIAVILFNYVTTAQNSNILNKIWKIERYIAVNGADTIVYFHKDSLTNLFNYAPIQINFQNNAQFIGKNPSGSSQSGTWSFVATNDSLTLNNETFAIHQLTASALITKNSIKQIIDTLGHTGMATLYLQFYVSSTVLPITLNSFEAKAENAINRITWQTESEVNSDFFIIEKSEDAIHWQNLTKVAAVGNSNKTNPYKTIDNQPYRLTYYRLQSVDKDGAKTFSKIISVVQSKNNAAPLKLYPNPARTMLTLEYTQAVTSLKIMNLYGKILRSIEPNELGKTELDISGFASGMYWIRINDQELLKFVKM